LQRLTLYADCIFIPSRDKLFYNRSPILICYVKIVVEKLRRRQMIYILHGQDSFTMQREMENIKKGMGDTDLLALNTTVLDGADITPEQVNDFCCTIPFLNPFRLIIIEGLLQRFEGSKKKAKDRPSGDDYNSPDFEKWKNLAGILKAIPETTTVMFVDHEITAKNPLLKSLAEIARIRVFPAMKEAGMRVWLGNKIKAAGGRISPDAVKMLIEYTGNDLWTLNNEVDKLLAYCGDRTISDEDVKEITSYSKDINIFNLVDQILEKKSSEAQRLVGKMMKEGASIQYIISMILRQLRLIIKAKYLEPNARAGSPEAGPAFTKDFVLEKSLKQAKAYSIAQIKDVYHKILEMDVNIKTGKYKEDMAADILVLELCK
jgi:DNA polymerase III subunit delta